MPRNTTTSSHGFNLGEIVTLDGETAEIIRFDRNSAVLKLSNGKIIHASYDKIKHTEEMS